MKKVLYIVSKIFPTILHTRLLHQSFASHHFTNYIYPVPLHPAITLSLRCTSLHFPSLHFTTLFNTFKWFSLHFTSFRYTFKLFPAHFIYLFIVLIRVQRPKHVVIYLIMYSITKSVVFHLYTFYRLWYLWWHTTGMKHLKILHSVDRASCNDSW